MNWSFGGAINNRRADKSQGSSDAVTLVAADSQRAYQVSKWRAREIKFKTHLIGKPGFTNI